MKTSPFRQFVTPTLGKKLGILFAFLALVTLGNLALSERLHHHVSTVSEIIDGGGRLRYISQQIALNAVRYAHEKTMDAAMMQRPSAEYKSRLAALEQGVAALGSEYETPEMAVIMEKLQRNSSDYLVAADNLKRFSAGSTEAVKALAPVVDRADNLLQTADAVVVNLVSTSRQIHARTDKIMLLLVLVEAMLLWGVFLYVRTRMIRPLIQLSDTTRRFAEGEHEARVIFYSQDEIGELVKNFNGTAGKVSRLIEEEQQLRQSAQESEVRYRDLVDGVDAIVWEADAESLRFSFVSQRAEYITGFSPSRWLEEPDFWVNRIVPEDRQRCLELCREATRSRTNHVFECRILTAGGELLWLRNVIRVVERKQAKPLLRGLMVDMTERKHAEEDLRLKQSAIEASNNGIIITDALTQGSPVIYVNPAFEQITGYSGDEVIGRNCNFLQSIDTDQPAVEEMRAALRERRSAHVVLRNYRKDGTLFWNELFIAPVREDSAVVKYFVGVMNDISERKRYEEQLVHQANHDALTGMPNRNLLEDRLSQAIFYAQRSNRMMAVLFLDLDHFKLINDSLGHDVGDHLLQVLGERLVQCVRSGDTVARMGGDEFVILLAELAHSEDVSPITQKILAATALPYLIDGHELFVTCSIGASLYPSDGNDVQTLLKNADAAMYRAKDTGRNTVQYFTNELNARAFERLLMENNLRHALERGELLLYFQPQVSLSNGRMVGVEALVRWQHPEMGMISPGDFIPLAEESGLIVPIGEWVLRTACAQNKAWQVAGLPPLSVAVNLSARQFRQDVPAMVSKVLQETNLEAHYLELEITESIIMQNPDEAAATLRKLKEMGVRLAIDDFGTGYSSLSYLKRFPIDRLKIDQSFVRDITTDPDDAAIAMAVIAMAHSLNLKVVAEGVETEAQLSYLHRRQCDEFQGYYFSRPESSENMAHQIAQNHCIPVELLSQQLTRSVLLVDDEPAVSAAMTRALRSSGYQIFTAASAQEGFELLASHAIQVVVSDQRMPGMTGTEFLTRVKGIYPETVRIVVSGTSDLVSLSQTINQGAIFKFLLKPWEDDELHNSIEDAFRCYEARKSR